MSDKERARVTPARIVVWAIAVVVGLVALFFVFRFVETLLPANF